MKKWIATGVVIGFLSGLVAVSFYGCSSDLLTGVGIGAGTSTAATEVQTEMQRSKAALAADLVATRKRLSETTDPAELVALREKLAKLEKKQFATEITEGVSNTIIEGLGKDWTAKEPETRSANAHWALNAFLAAIYGIEKWRSNKKNEKIEVALKK